MQISLDSNLNILATTVMNFDIKTGSETFEYLLFNQHINKSLNNIANYFEFLHVQILWKSVNFMIIRLKYSKIHCPLVETVYTVIYPFVWNGCNIMHF